MSAIDSYLLGDYKVLATKPALLNSSNAKLLATLHKFMTYKSDKSTTQKDVWFTFHFLAINSISVFPTTPAINVLVWIRKCNW
jgi:hypothetical protein